MMMMMIVSAVVDRLVVVVVVVVIARAVEVRPKEAPQPPRPWNQERTQSPKLQNLDQGI